MLVAVVVEEDIELAVFVVEENLEIEVEVHTEIVGEDIVFAAESCYMYLAADSWDDNSDFVGKVVDFAGLVDFDNSVDSDNSDSDNSDSDNSVDSDNSDSDNPDSDNPDSDNL